MRLTAPRSDFLVLGGGIVGLATAWKLIRTFSDCTVRVLEMESDVARHQSGNNSGVIHSGIYYKPGSEKAKLCRVGKAEMEAFCRQHEIPFDQCGKVIVATRQNELEQLEKISQRGQENGVAFRQIQSDELREIEPHAAGIRALHVPGTGIVDYRAVCQKLSHLIQQSGGTIDFDQEVTGINVSASSVTLQTQRGSRYACGTMINCGGLYSDRLCRLSGTDPKVRIVPFRGEYYELIPERQSLVNHLIYPVPDPSFPFLGVHLTRMIGGGVECGPNAVLAFSRSGYRFSTINPVDFVETMRYRGFRKLATKHWKTGLGEMRRSVSKSAFVAALQKLLPSLRRDDLVRGRAGVRAQAVDPQGNLVDDFLVRKGPCSIHVLNAPSPAATSSLAIADRIIHEIQD